MSKSSARIPPGLDSEATSPFSRSFVFTLPWAPVVPAGPLLFLMLLEGLGKALRGDEAGQGVLG